MPCRQPAGPRISSTATISSSAPFSRSVTLPRTVPDLSSRQPVASPPTLSPSPVQAGKIYFVAPSGGDFTSIQAGLNALASGDILYMKNGVSAMSVVTVPASRVSPTRPIAVVVYPGAASQAGDATHDAFTIVNTGAGQQMAYAKFSVYNGTSGGTAIFLQSNSRMVGNKVQGPKGIGSSGCALGRGNHLAYLGNEFTSCGGDASDSLYHVLYIAGYRGMGAGSATGESN